MIPPPGLLCAACGRPFGGRYATVTDDGWIHAGSCDRVCQVAGCEKPYHSAGYCNAHWSRWKRHGDPLAGKNTPQPLTADDVEDIEWMVTTGENITGACRRLGRTRQSLDRALKRAGRPDLYLALVAREGDWNSPGRQNNPRYEAVA